MSDQNHLLQQQSDKSSSENEGRVAGQVGLSRPIWWLMFGLDAVLLSWFFQCFKEFTTEPNWFTMSSMTLSTTMLLLCSALLIYDGYAREKEKGLVKNTVPLFDKLYAYQQNKGTSKHA